MSESILERLKSNAQPTLLAPPEASIDDLVAVQEELLITMPADFREFLLTAADLVIGRLEPCTISDPGLHTYLPEVAALAWDRGVPREFIPFCAASEGYYVVAQGGEVTFWNLEEMEFEDGDWANVWSWADSVWLE
jgi:hypothetical protein